MINRPKFFVTFCLLAIIIGFLYWSAIYLSLFWLLPWYDIPMHILGGFWVSLAVFAVYQYLGKEISTNVNIVFVLLPITLLVGILWEIFEYKTGLAFVSDDGYFFDTVKDLVDDVVGSVVAFYYLNHKYPRDIIEDEFS
jgi:hypothetical protein